MDDCDVLIVGAGQAGLAAGYHLRESGLRTVIVDGADRVGASWRSRWDSLRLFTPARYAGLPGMRFPGPPEAYPGKDEVAEYLAEYAARFALPVRLGTAVTDLRRDGAGGYVAITANGVLQAGQVVVATGPFGAPYVPPAAEDLSPDVPQMHSWAYRSADHVAGPEIGAGVLVVGGGNSGFQIAADLAAAGRRVSVSIGRRNACVPQRLLGRDIFWWQATTGLLRVSADSWLGRRMREADGTVIGLSARELRRRGIVLRARVSAAVGRVVRFADGGTLEPDAVVWATGFRQDYRWLHVPGVLDEDGRVHHRRGITPAPGLYVLGLPWLHTTGSALLGFVGADAAYLAGRIQESAKLSLSS
ncbi:NAD(P)/FAD-dependent oxidoreductase [Fodinicola feengrottensis]|uniref:NAD(P)/FAD-dependent oxidoreductase n=1 Tax=Fodinicola feengrottensis TaxID=435914 RepID=A0ABP4RLC5_9ACTN